MNPRISCLKVVSTQKKILITFVVNKCQSNWEPFYSRTSYQSDGDSVALHEFRSKNVGNYFCLHGKLLKTNWRSTGEQG